MLNSSQYLMLNVHPFAILQLQKIAQEINYRIYAKLIGLT